jgi:competence protein ComEA
MMFRGKAVKKHISYAVTAIFCLIVSLAFLPGCRGGNEIEINLPPEKFAPTRRVFVTGGVDTPGLYSVADNDSLRLILNLAGGVLPDADLTRLRLYVPVAGETGGPQKIDINRAEAWLIAALPGIGEVGAGRIVAYREQSGLFRTIDDLARVEGIGEITLNKIRDLVTVAE